MCKNFNPKTLKAVTEREREKERIHCASAVC